MKNTVKISSEFFFKGEKLTPSMVLECDQYLSREGKLPNIYPLLARENNMDLYSYEYEILQSELIIYSEPQGLISQHICDGVLDELAFIEAWHMHDALLELEDIALNHMGVDDLNTQPDLKKALLLAYAKGKSKV